MQDILAACVADIQAVRDRDPACDSFIVAALYFKGFQALQSYRVAHWMWQNGRKVRTWGSKTPSVPSDSGFTSMDLVSRPEFPETASQALFCTPVYRCAIRPIPFLLSCALYGFPGPAAQIARDGECRNCSEAVMAHSILRSSRIYV